jgi:hypothetical protein
VRLVLLALALSLGTAGAARAQDFDHQHKAWDALLRRHVVLISEGRASQLRYAALARERAALEAYLGSLSAVPRAEFEGWAKPERMAFLINAYNAFTVEKILTRYPKIESIWDFGRFFGNPFKDRFFRLLGEDVSLDWIEHDTLRVPGAYDEPRLHYVLNCAAVSCPMLREEAYVPGRLAEQLEDQARRFLSDHSRNRYSAAQRRLEVSKVFDWYRVDWERRARGFDGGAPPSASLAEYFAPYAGLLAATPQGERQVAERNAPIAYLEYDWSLNDAPGP